MLHADQPTPPFNSPYQRRGSRNPTLLESPYPSPIKHENQSTFAQGLGLYNYPQPMTHGLPPSPQPSESWNTPMVSDSIADPWASGAFDHPVSQSPLPWASSHTSPRSSLSSYTREMSAFSHEGSEHGFPSIKVEYEYPTWASEVSFSADRSNEMQTLSSPRTTPLTVAPERLSAGIFSYDNTYSASTSVKYEESSSVYDYSDRGYDRAPSEDSTDSSRLKNRSSYSRSSVSRDRNRNRRHTDPTNAAFRCPLCPDKGFARRYNFNQHMLTHDSTRKKDNICPYPGCGKEFVRKTDLSRHDASVHQKAKAWKCARCPQAFSRKDTLRRHEEDGCRGRYQVPMTDARMLQHLRHDGYAAATGL